MGGAIIGQHFEDTTCQGKGNILGIGVAGSGSGKNAVLNGAKDLLKFVGKLEAYRGKLKSEQEIERSIAYNQIAVYLIDEVELYFRKIKQYEL